MLDPNFLFLSPEKSNFLMKSMRGIASRRGSIYQKYFKSKMGSQLEILDPSSFRGGSQRRQSRFEVLTDRIEYGDPNFPDPLHLHSNCLDYDENKVSLESRRPFLRKSSEDGTTMVYKSYWLGVINKLLGYFDLKRIDKVGYFEKLEIEPQIEIEYSDYNFLPDRMKLAYEQEFLMLGMLIEDLNIDEDILGLHILHHGSQEGQDTNMNGENSPTPTPFGSPLILSFPEPEVDLDVDTPYEMDWETTDIGYMERLYAPNRIRHADEE